MRATGLKYRVRCDRCGWRGVRADHIECECGEDYEPWCSPGGPSSHCPRGVVYPCPRCEGTVGLLGCVLPRSSARHPSR